MLGLMGACDSKTPEGAKNASQAGATPAGAMVPAAFAGALPPGWAVVVRGGGVEATQHAAHAAFALGKGESLSSMVAAAGQTATYTCALEVTEPGDHRFIVETQGGGATLSVLAKGVEAPVATAATTGEGVARSAWAPLSAGSFTVSVKFTRSGDNAARLRTMWERKRSGETPPFLAEPLPVESTSVPRFAFDAVVRGEDVARGRVLLGEMNCVACHAAPSEAAGLIPSRQAPLLEEIGRRASPQWLMKWITDPQSVKPGSGMPTLHVAAHGSGGASHAVDAEAIAQYLVAPYYTASDETQPVANERPVLEAGKRIYHQVGCVACHGPLTSPAEALENPSESGKIPSVRVAAPFGDIVGKWRPVALSAFLRDPLKAHPSGRMPNLKLGPEEGDLLANYLVSSWTKRGGDGKAIVPEAMVIDKAKVEAGRVAFVSHGCSACHQMGPNSPKVEVGVRATPLKELAAKVDAWQGCLNPSDHATPRYTLTDDDRRALGAAIKSLPGVRAHAPLEVARATMDALNCRACHAKEGVGGPADGLRPYFTTINDVELGDEGRIPPRLTNVGWKLTTQWLRQVLTEGGAARPYMATRMPQFGAGNLGALAEQLAGLEGIAPDVQEPEPAAGPELAAAGRALVGEKGLNCISCHVFGDHAPAGTPGPAITAFGERLRFSWFESYAHAPTRFKPGTRMPSFWQTGTSAATSILAGEPTKQLHALWAYFQQGEFAAVPEGIKTDTGLALQPVNGPMVFRTFLKDAGSRGIAVGWPGNGPHFGFDAEQVRLRDAWTGDFVDASSAWRGRGGMKADGQGPEVWTAPEGPAVIVAAELTAWPEKMGAEAGIRYKGYEFNGKREPTFVSTIKTEKGNATLREWFGPTQTKGRLFARRMVVSAHGGVAVWVNAGPDADVAKVEGGEASTVELSGRKFVKVTPRNENDVTITLVVGKAKAVASPTPPAAPKGAGS